MSPFGGGKESQMKILIMCFAKIKYVPYMNFYLENLDKKKSDIHILYWNRDLQEEDLSKYEGCTFHEFRYYQEDDVAKLSKIKSFLKYRKFAKKLIKTENFDFILVLSSLPGVIISDVLKKSYKGRYIFDYRDTTYEKFAPFKRIIASITKNSAATFVSSDAFRTLLPDSCKRKIYTSHNLLIDSLEHCNDKEFYGISSKKIRISFWGFIRHEEINKELIRKIAADDRFELHYYGREQQTALNLKAYAEEIGAENVFFHGEYKPEERYEFIKTTDIIHNVYSATENPPMSFAMPNKYYDGIIFKLPQLCAEGTFVAKKAASAGVGFSCNPYDRSFTEKVFNYYNSIDQKAFFESCENELLNVFDAYHEGAEIIKKEVYK